MAPTTDTTFTDWLDSAQVAEYRLTPAQRSILEAAFQFRQRCGTDYYSTRLLSHFLLHSRTGLKVAVLARLLGLSRSAASAQQGLPAKAVVQAAHHRLAGRAHGKLLARFAGPVAQFLWEHPQASRYDLLDFLDHTWGVRVTRQALHRFLKKYGLVQACRRRPEADFASPPPVPSMPAPAAASPARATADRGVGAAAADVAQPSLPVPPPAAEFFLPPPTTPAPSSSCPSRSTGWPRPKAVSPMTSAACPADC